MFPTDIRMLVTVNNIIVFLLIYGCVIVAAILLIEICLHNILWVILIFILLTLIG